MPNISINGALNKVYLRQKPLTKTFNNFCVQLENLKSSIEKGIAAKANTVPNYVNKELHGDEMAKYQLGD